MNLFYTHWIFTLVLKLINACIILAFASENLDLKLILRQTEKELEDYKMRYKSQENSVQSQVGEFEDKVWNPRSFTVLCRVLISQKSVRYTCNIVFVYWTIIILPPANEVQNNN